MPDEIVKQENMDIEVISSEYRPPIVVIEYKQKPPINK